MTNEEKRAKREAVGDDLLQVAHKVRETVLEYLKEVGIPEENLTMINLGIRRFEDGTWSAEVEAYRYDSETEKSRYIFNAYENGDVKSHNFHEFMIPFLGEEEQQDG